MSEEEKKAIDDLFSLTHINGYIDLYTQKKAKIHTLDLSKWQNGVKVLLNLIKKQQKEIDEKSTIIMAGAEKVKQLEKGNRSLMESRIKWKNRYYKEKVKNKECINKDKIREKIKELEKLYGVTLEGAMTSYEMFHFVRSYIDKVKNILEELLEEN